jgi:hypothetical protein
MVRLVGGTTTAWIFDIIGRVRISDGLWHTRTIRAASRYSKMRDLP